MAGDGETTEESEIEIDDYKIELKDCKIELKDIMAEETTTGESEIEVDDEWKPPSSKRQRIELLKDVALNMADETTTGESEIEVDDEWERAMTKSTASACSVKMVACPYDGCPWFSSKPKRLPTHLLTHTGERPFACQVHPLSQLTFKSAVLTKHTCLLTLF